MFHPFEVKRTHLKTQDGIVDLDDLTLLEDSGIFSLTHEPTKPYELYPEIITIISYEANLDLATIERSGYNLLDMLAELGGI